MMLPIDRILLEELPTAQLQALSAHLRFDSEPYDKIVESVRKCGQPVFPILVIKTGTGFYRVLNGVKRVQACRELGITHILAEIYEEPTMEIPIDSIISIGWNGANQEMVESIREEGVKVPIVVRKRKDNYQLIDGYQRVEACRELGITTIHARTIE